MKNIENINSTKQETQVISRKRVADHGEVLTRKREVKAMLDLVKSETERIDSRFLEPACGTGNFLTVILDRKLRVVEARYGKSQLDYERYAILAVSSIYGIDILEDNVQQCRHRLFGIFDLYYLRLFKNKANDNCRGSVRYVLERNIIHGDALSLKTAGDNPKPIVFSEWALVSGSKFKRRDFAFHDLTPPVADQGPSLFGMNKSIVDRDTGDKGFIPDPIKTDYPPTTFWELPHAK
jgi:hypothetical protein